MHIIKGTLRKSAQKMGYDIVRFNAPRRSPAAKKPEFPVDFDEETQDIIRHVRYYTRTSPERIFSLCESVRHIVRHDIPGAIVECGVWRGGSMMAAALTLKSMNCEDRDLYLFDTFEGNPDPGAEDVYFTGQSAGEMLSTHDKEDERSYWCKVNLANVQHAMERVDYAGKIHYVQGKVEETIPEHAPSNIALLRLDTDWYESTRHELVHLFPLISPHGVLIIDDYGHWQGARKAVDEYLEQQQINMLLCRIDSTGRMGVVLP
jgi:hypothetical protein